SRRGSWCRFKAQVPPLFDTLSVNLDRIGGGGLKRGGPGCGQGCGGELRSPCLGGRTKQGLHGGQQQNRLAEEPAIGRDEHGERVGQGVEQACSWAGGGGGRRRRKKRPRANVGGLERRESPLASQGSFCLSQRYHIRVTCTGTCAYLVLAVLEGWGKCQGTGSRA
ncbi:hypothetical protein ACO22_08177, partial [Paracoccidioides brasiliensis]